LRCGVVVLSPPGTEEIGDMGRDIEFNLGMG
jgi:hypothetical protein